MKLGRKRAKGMVLVCVEVDGNKGKGRALYAFEEVTFLDLSNLVHQVEHM